MSLVFDLAKAANLVVGALLGEGATSLTNWLADVQVINSAKKRMSQVIDKSDLPGCDKPTLKELVTGRRFISLLSGELSGETELSALDAQVQVALESVSPVSRDILRKELWSAFFGVVHKSSPLAQRLEFLQLNVRLVELQHDIGEQQSWLQDWLGELLAAIARNAAAAGVAHEEQLQVIEGKVDAVFSAVTSIAPTSPLPGQASRSDASELQPSTEDTSSSGDDDGPFDSLLERARDDVLAGRVNEGMELFDSAISQIEEQPAGIGRARLLSEARLGKALVLFRGDDEQRRQAWGLACEATDPEELAADSHRLGIALHVKAELALALGRLSEAKAAVLAANQIDPDDTSGNTAFCQGLIARAEHKNRIALDRFMEASQRAAARVEKSGERLQREGARTDLVRSLTQLAETQVRAGMYVEAGVSWETASSHCDKIRDWPLIIGTLLGRANFLFSQGAMGDGFSVLESAVARARSAGDENAMAACLELRARALLAAGDRDAGLQGLREVLATSSDSHQRVALLQTLAAERAEQEDTEAARAHLLEAESEAVRIRDGGAIVEIVEQRRLLDLYENQSEIESGFATLRDTRRAERDPEIRVRCSLAMAAHLVILGEGGRAIKEFERASKDAELHELASLQASALVDELAVFLEIDDLEGAEGLLARAQAAVDANSDEEQAGNLLMWSIRLRLRQRRVIEASQLMKDLRDAIDRHPMPRLKSGLAMAEQDLEYIAHELRPSDATWDELAQEYRDLDAWFRQERARSDDYPGNGSEPPNWRRTRASIASGKYSPVGQLWYYMYHDDISARFNAEAGSVGIVISSDASVIKGVQDDLGWMFDLTGFVADSVESGEWETFIVPNWMKLRCVNWSIVLPDPSTEGVEV